MWLERNCKLSLFVNRSYSLTSPLSLRERKEGLLLPQTKGTLWQWLVKSDNPCKKVILLPGHIATDLDNLPCTNGVAEERTGSNGKVGHSRARRRKARTPPAMPWVQVSKGLKSGATISLVAVISRGKETLNSKTCSAKVPIEDQWKMQPIM